MTKKTSQSYSRNKKKYDNELVTGAKTCRAQQLFQIRIEIKTLDHVADWAILAITFNQLSSLRLKTFMFFPRFWDEKLKFQNFSGIF